MSRLRQGACLIILIGVAEWSWAADELTGRRKDQLALKAYGTLVGEWKGTGQVQRGSGRGAWRESATWAWKLSASSAALEMKLADGKYLKSGLLRPAADSGTFEFAATLADDSVRTFRGKPGSRDVLVLAATDDDPGLHRITLTPLHETRFLVLLEARDEGAGKLRRLGEVGYTRQGVAFAVGESYPLCVVTEGRGTIRVQYQGKEYWVCCSGCKDLFDDDPAAVIAEAEQRKKAKAK
jgi:YHS domain-containing protein